MYFQLYDQEMEIVETAIEILEEACEDEVLHIMCYFRITQKLKSNLVKPTTANNVLPRNRCIADLVL